MRVLRYTQLAQPNSGLCGSRWQGKLTNSLLGKLKHLDLFSGIGGFALSARWMGWETVAFCEKDKFCHKVLRKHWPEVPIIDDIFKLNEEKLCEINIQTTNQKGKEAKNETHCIDIVTGGFP